MTINANALTDLVVAKEYLGIPAVETSFNSKVERLINAASEFFETETSRKLITQTHTDYQDGRSSNRITLRQYPVTGGPAVGPKPELYIDGSSIFDSSTIQDPTTYFLDDPSDELVKISGINGGISIFPKGTRNIKVIYEAGLGTVLGEDLPADLVEACLEYIMWKYDQQNDRRIGRTNRSKGDESIAYGTAVPDQIMAVVVKYTRIDFSPPVGVLNR